ncbi:MAG: hydantoinase B/oxoprolinase family protein [Halodesulfurarchaeum sp.]
MSGSDDIDSVTLEVIRNAFATIAEEMSANLVRSSYSPNIKERKDASSAVFDPGGRMLAQAENVPVHLGAMPHSVRACIQAYSKDDLNPGDTIIHNTPFQGGAHLPDITFVSPVFSGNDLIAFVANRAHHADVGGARAGSVSADTTSIFEEGIQIPPIRLFEGGGRNENVFDLVVENVRTPEERAGDLRAQQAANETGIRRFSSVLDRHGEETVRRTMEAVQEYSEDRMRAAIRDLPDGEYGYTDVMDGDGTGLKNVQISVEVGIEDDEITVDFSGSDPQVPGPINAPMAVTTSAAYYTIRTVTDPTIPPNHGCYRPIAVEAPEGSVLNAEKPAAVVGGNLEVSQRIVDTILGAMAEADVDDVVAAANGSMNNVTIGGYRDDVGTPYTFYETIGGGYGARPGKDGVDGIHAHMTNTKNTPVEAIESSYPLRVDRYELRPDTGGAGTYRGGLGIRRDLVVLDPGAEFSLLSDRRRHQPYGLDGGEPGAPGADVLIREGEEQPIDAKTTLDLNKGDVLSIRTPGGGGYGPPEDRDPDDIESDLRNDRVSEAQVTENYPWFDRRDE